MKPPPPAASVRPAKRAVVTGHSTRSLPATGHVRLVDGPHFRLDRLDGQPDSDIAERYSGGPLLVVPLDGAVIAEGHTFPAGTCAILPSLGDVRLAPGAKALIAQPV